MKSPNRREQACIICLIADQKRWREHSSSALQQDGFMVKVCDTAHVALLLRHVPDRETLIVLSCPAIEGAEMQLIKQILVYRCHLLVLCERLPIAVMRTLFLWGVDDIADQPQNDAELILVIRKLLESLVPRNSYQSVERAGRT